MIHEGLNEHFSQICRVFESRYSSPISSPWQSFTLFNLFLRATAMFRAS